MCVCVRERNILGHVFGLLVFVAKNTLFREKFFFLSKFAGVVDKEHFLTTLIPHNIALGL